MSRNDGLINRGVEVANGGRVRWALWGKSVTSNEAPGSIKPASGNRPCFRITGSQGARDLRKNSNS